MTDAFDQLETKGKGKEQVGKCRCLWRVHSAFDAPTDYI
jgi:hypothetical protein